MISSTKEINYTPYWPPDIRSARSFSAQYKADWVVHAETGEFNSSVSGHAIRRSPFPPIRRLSSLCDSVGQSLPDILLEDFRKVQQNKALVAGVVVCLCLLGFAFLVAILNLFVNVPGFVSGHASDKIVWV